MIQYWLKDTLKPIASGVKITVDYEPDAKTYITVFYEGGGMPAQFDIDWRYPNYMIWVESEDWGKAQYLAHLIFDNLQQYCRKNGKQQILVEYQDVNGQVLSTELVELHSLTAMGDINPLGILDGKMRYSLNFAARITNIREETTNEAPT